MNTGSLWATSSAQSWPSSFDIGKARIVLLLVRFPAKELLSWESDWAIHRPSQDKMMSSSRTALRKASAVARASGEVGYQGLSQPLGNVLGASHRSFSAQAAAQQSPSANQAVMDAAIRRLALASPAQSSLKTATAELRVEPAAPAGRATDSVAESGLPVEPQEAADAAPELAAGTQKQPKYLRAFPTMTASLGQEDAPSSRQGHSRSYHTRKLSIVSASADTGTKAAFFLDTLALVSGFLPIGTKPQCAHVFTSAHEGGADLSS